MSGGSRPDADNTNLHSIDDHKPAGFVPLPYIARSCESVRSENLLGLFFILVVPLEDHGAPHNNLASRERLVRRQIVEIRDIHKLDFRTRVGSTDVAAGAVGTVVHRNATEVFGLRIEWFQV